VSAAISPRTRLLAIIAVLLAAAGAAAMLTIARRHSKAAPPPPAARQAGSAAPALPHLTRHASHGAATGDSGVPGLPTPVAQQLKAGRIVVVSLYDPNAKVDSTARQEATAGAALAHAAFVAVDVTGRQVDGLNQRFGVIQDPAVLVLRPPGNLIVRIDGFADRDTVAQAAANAGS
jgi:hypothetical protein